MITFDMDFFGPFHVSTGVPSEGMDSPIDLTCPLPSTTLKGLMRAEAVERLGIKGRLVDEIFGRATTSSTGDLQRSSPGAWQWSDATFARLTATPYARIAVDEHGLTRQGFLAFGMHAWASGGTFTVEPKWLLDARTVAQHSVILRACAASVSTLGGDRRRGSGWVSITAGPWTPADTLELRALMEAAP